ncbi:protein KTI12 homolog [Ornithodoros turicata]|uniref:protein KTI12 homolog n=1 Tax=Ornithodoros turicata TaxID=34597 RepID=UPI0031397471
MPLVVVCGFPSSGKSLRTQQLKEYFEKELEKPVHVVSSDSDLSKNNVFADSNKEKELRGKLKSEVSRLLSKDNTVILDAANYIKGYRYELYCLSKSVKTTQCTVHTDTAVDRCWEWNTERPQEEQYTKEIFDALIQRFEHPDSRNRWDSPLFTIHYDEELPVTAISEALFDRKAPPPNMATQCQPLSSTNFLYDVDRVTQETLQAILREQNTCSIGDYIAIPGCTEKILLQHKFRAAELSRHRRQFISYAKTHPADIAQIPNLFVHYINETT